MSEAPPKIGSRTAEKEASSPLTGDRLHIVREQICEALQQDLRFEGSCWTCTPSDSWTDDDIPLTIDGFPVVIPVRCYYPLLPLSSPPPDPHFKVISPIAQVSDEVISEVFAKFTDALGFYVLINGDLQVVVPDDFDYESGLARLPTEFGGLKVTLIPQSFYPTADQQPLTGAPSVSQARVTATPSPASVAIPPIASPGRPLTLRLKEVYGNTIRPTINNGKPPKDRIEGKVGVALTPIGERSGVQKLLTLSTHVLSTFAAASKVVALDSEDWISHLRVTSVRSQEDVRV
jgi:hypothetical protein